MAFILTQQDVDQITALVRGLPLDESVSGIRSLSGEGNNLLNPSLGMADTPFLRLTPAYYGVADGLGNMGVNPIFAQLDPRVIRTRLDNKRSVHQRQQVGLTCCFQPSDSTSTMD